MVSSNVGLTLVRFLIALLLMYSPFEPPDSNVSSDFDPDPDSASSSDS